MSINNISLKLYLSLLILSFTTLTSCATSVVVKSKSEETMLLVPKLSETNEQLLWMRPAILNTNSDNNLLSNECGVSALAPRTGLLGSVAGVFIKPVIDLLIDNVEEKLKNEIKLYTTVASASKQIDFYTSISPLISNVKCFRFIKLVNVKDITGTNNSHVILDFIGKISLNNNMDALIIKPLRLYSDGISAKSADGKIGISAELAAEAFYREDNIGKKLDVFKETIATSSYNIQNGPLIDYFNKPSIHPSTLNVNHTPLTYVPIMPYSNNSISNSITSVLLTFNFAEAGTKKEWMTNLLTILDSSQDDLSTVLSDAIKAKAGIEDDD